ncbi:MAG: trypsin-like serine protease [Caldilinea sp.]|nr:trypsin-like serine protease [Caldilinea sp.]
MRLKAVLLPLFALLVATSPFVPVYAQESPAAEPDIVGGQEATPGEYPWQAYLEIGPYGCGGALIAPQWVLTAAHCVWNDYGDLASPSQVTVYLGQHNLLYYEPSEQTYGASQVIPNPEYNPSNSDGDLALIKLASPATLNDRVAVLPLLTSPADDALAAPGVLSTVTGWGATTTDDNNSWSPVLLEVAIPIISNTTCNQAMPGPFITANQICAGYEEGGKDSCYGDSGGALVVPDGAGGWKHAGIVSYGDGCAKADRYGVYTRTSRYIDWIRQYVTFLDVTGFSPASGRPGTQVMISGAGFSSVTAIEFTGTPAQFSVSNDSTIVATVPNGAVAGPIRVRNGFDSMETADDFQPLYSLGVQASGAGTVTVTPGNAICTAADPCERELVGGTTASLSPAAGRGQVFAGWRGACAAGPDTCSLFMNTDQSAIAVFAPPTSTLSVNVTGNGSGLVMSNIAAIACGDTCSQQLPTRTTLTLSAQPAAGMLFLGWSGACSGYTLTCPITMIGDQQVGAGFAVAQYLHLPLIRQ